MGGTGLAPMAHRLIAAVGLLALVGLGGDRLVERPLPGIGTIALPAAMKPAHDVTAYDDDPARLYYRFADEYGLASLGSGTAYKQLLTVSLMATTATDADYRAWPERFSPLYSTVRAEPEVALGAGRLRVAAGRYAQNALDEPAHVYIYAEPARRLQIAWHVVDAGLAPEAVRALLPRVAASFAVTNDQRAKFAEMAGRGARAAAAEADAVARAKQALARAGFGAAAPGRPVVADGVYVEWMDDPEPRFQLLKPLGLVRHPGPARFFPPRRADAAGRPFPFSGSIGWRTREDDAWLTTNRDDDYLPLPGIARELARRQDDPATTLYYYATTIRVALADPAAIDALGNFLAELPAVERAWQAGEIVPLAGGTQQ